MKSEDLVFEDVKDCCNETGKMAQETRANDDEDILGPVLYIN